jgi:hypothetical protein
MSYCKDIDNNLPLYEDNLLSDREKKSLEEHLKSCPECSKRLAQLQKTEKIVQELKEVEPPPWFKQKIMARVREEAGRETLTQKWFYPLRIKIPVQILATIVIAVLAVYIYRSGDEQFKEALPLGVPPVMQAKQDQKPAELPKVQSAVPSIGMQKKSSVTHEAQNGKVEMYDASVSGGGTKTAIQEKMMATASDSERVRKQESAADKKDIQDVNRLSVTPAEPQAELQAKQEEPKKAIALRSMEKESKSEHPSAGFAQKSKLYKAVEPSTPAAPQAMVSAKMEQSQPIISLSVKDLNTAVTDVEKILTRYEARIKSRQLMDDKVFIQAEVSGKYLKNILSELKGIGQLEEKGMPDEGVNGSIAVIIEIKIK